MKISVIGSGYVDLFYQQLEQVLCDYLGKMHHVQAKAHGTELKRSLEVEN